jgi:hypothetical protein
MCSCWRVYAEHNHATHTHRPLRYIHYLYILVTYLHYMFILDTYIHHMYISCPHVHISRLLREVFGRRRGGGGDRFYACMCLRCVRVHVMHLMSLSNHIMSKTKKSSCVYKHSCTYMSNLLLFTYQSLITL